MKTINENTKKSRKRRSALAKAGLKEMRGLIVSELEESILKQKFKEEIKKMRELQG